MIKESLLWDHPALAGVTLEKLKAEGYSRLTVATPDKYAPHAQGNFPTPSGKCEFKSSRAKDGNFVTPLYRQGYDGQQSGEPVDPLPHYIPPRESVRSNPTLGRKFPLSLVSPKSHAFITSNYGNLPKQQKHNGRQAILMHPNDAERRRCSSGSRVRVSSRHGEFEAIAEITDSILEGVVASPVGHWRHGEFGQKTVQSALSSAHADLGHGPTFSDILVEIKPVEETDKDRAGI